MPGVVLQAYQRGDDDDPRVGFTVTRKVGNAVIRNRVKRRLREAAREMIGKSGQCGFDYVLIGRQGTIARPYSDLLADLSRALKQVHARMDRRPAASAGDNASKR